MISVCLASYNGEKYIEEQLRSILDQLNPEDEIIVSDNDSKDRTLEIIKSINDRRIKLYSFYSKSIIKNFENSIINSKGEYIFLSDQDDVWIPGKIKKSMQILEFKDLVLSDCKIVDEDLNILNGSYFELNQSAKGFSRNLLKTNSYMGCCMAFKRNILNKILPFPKNIHIHDMWIGLVAELHYSIEFLDEPLLLHRIHTDNSSDTFIGSSNSLFRKLYLRIIIIYNLIKISFR